MFAQSWRRWGTSGRLVVLDPEALEPARATVDLVMDTVEEAISTWRDDSELMTLRPGWNRVSPTLAGALTSARWAAELTGGAVDPTLGAAVLAWREGGVPEPGGRWRELRVEGSRVLLPEGVRLDLGALGKAYAADLAAARAARRTGSGVLVGLGGDLASAGPGPAGGWPVRVRDLASDPELVVSLHTGWAVATSSTEHRQAVPGDPATSHLLDPATGRSVRSPWRTATVVAGSCVSANAHATAAIVLGHPVDAPLATRLVGHDGRVVAHGGFPAQTGVAA